jgi:SAM-dependent methyltransferase
VTRAGDASRNSELRADRDYLTTVAYADDGLLRDRVSLSDHQDPRVDLVAETLARLGSLEGKTVGDIGCGNGAYLRALSRSGALAIGLDLSAGMLKAVPTGRTPTLVADGQYLPLKTASLDAALAMHMLYHVPDLALAVAEARRALRAGGRFVAAIGGPGYLAEANDLSLTLLRQAGLDPGLQDLGLTNTRLPVAKLGILLRESFAEVELAMLVSQVVLHSASPLVRHASSTTAAKLATAQGSDMTGQLARAVEDTIARDGPFRVTTEVAIFTAQA